MNFKAVVKTIGKQNVYYRHGFIKSPDELFDFVIESGYRCAILNPDLKCGSYNYVSYFKNENNDNQIEVEYAEACSYIGKEGKDVKFRVEEETKVLSVEVKGSYTLFPSAYDFVLNEVKKNGYEMLGPIREVYIIGPWAEKNDSNFISEIQVPIK